MNRRVITRQAAQWAVSAKATHAAVNQAGKFDVQGIKTDTPFFHAAGFEILNQHISSLQHAQQLFTLLWVAQIKRCAALIAVQPKKVAGRALGIKRRAPAARFVAMRRLDLQNIRAMIRQDLRAIRATQDAGEVDDFDALEAASVICFLHISDYRRSRNNASVVAVARLVHSHFTN